MAGCGPRHDRPLVPLSGGGFSTTDLWVMSPQGIGQLTRRGWPSKNLVRSVKEWLLDAKGQRMSVGLALIAEQVWQRDRIRLALICPVASKRIFASVEESPGI
jgi:hypothetical protein